MGYCVHQINAKALQKDALWVNMNEEELANPDLFEELKKNFGAKVISEYNFLWPVSGVCPQFISFMQDQVMQKLIDWLCSIGVYCNEGSSTNCFM